MFGLDRVDALVEKAYQRVRDVEIQEDPLRRDELPVEKCPPNIRMILRMVVVIVGEMTRGGW